jgi:hypothetical protein
MRWFRARHTGDRKFELASSRLISETEAFMTGDLAGRLGRRSVPIPGWARLNSLAHGDLHGLRTTRHLAMARRSATLADLTEESWRSAQNLLARELNELVGNDPGLLLEVQRHVLVPLELQLMRRDGLTAFELVELTRSALRSSIP